ncbi:MAG: multicopper oxidase family protein [Caulobacteraceae bacterium]
MSANRTGALGAATIALFVGGHALAAQNVQAPACARPAAGSAVTPPPSLYSQRGALTVDLDYVSSVDAAHRTLYCFVTRDGLESPTLHVRPGDTLNINLRNRLAAPPAGATGAMAMAVGSDVCGDTTMNAASVNMHFHGTNTAPTCHSDEVIHTLVNPGGTFQYHVKFPVNEPPGLYWYHPHVHGQSEAAVLGRASGAIVVEGIEKVQPDVARLPERVLVIRDQTVGGRRMPGGRKPSWDLSLNYVPIDFPSLTPAVIAVRPGRREFWRMVNASADTVMDVELKYDGVPQPLEVVGLDGVPTGSQDGTGQGRAVWRKHILMPTGGRAEFIVTTPTSGVGRAALETRAVDTGPAGDNDTARTLAVLSADGAGAVGTMRSLLASGAAPPAPLFDRLDGARITARRTLYFSEVFEESHIPDEGPIQFYITVKGQTPRLFSPDNPPAIVTRQASVEEWTIENRTEEVHEFHIHQIHFKLVGRDGTTLPPDQQQYLDTVHVPYWRGRGPYPSVTVLMDFRGQVTGDFVYHCHILEHEDGGMMAIIRVLPRVSAAR